MWRVLKYFGRGLKSEKYCKTCKTYITDWEIIKKKAKVLTLGVAAPSFSNAETKH